MLVWLLASAAARADEPFRFVQWSDFHAGKHFRAAAWEEAMREGLARRPQALVFTGDVGDNDDKSFLEPLEAFLKKFADRLAAQRCPLVLTLGNNDVRLNYQTDAALLAETSAIFQRQLGPLYYLDDLGNGVHPQRMGGYRWISFNTQIFSPRNRYPGCPEQTRRTLDWLQAELEREPEAPVMLVVHTPPCWESFTGEPAWRIDVLRRFLELVRAHPGEVVVLGGHFHRNELHAIRRPQGDVPVLSCGSTSSKFGYWPNWREYRLGEQGRAYRVHYAGRPGWTRRYQLDDLAAYPSLWQRNEKAYLDYMNDHYAHHADARSRALRPQVRLDAQRFFWVEGAVPAP